VVPSILQKERSTICFFTVFLVLMVLGASPALVVELVSNLALVDLMAEPACASHASSACTRGVRETASPWSGSAAARWEPILVAVDQLLPTSDALQLRRAEVAFSLGNSSEAATLLPALELSPLPHLDTGTYSAATRTRLMKPGLYEHYLITAHQKVTTKKFDEAIDAFRWAFSLAPEYA
jgi:hypothetical protein